MSAAASAYAWRFAALGGLAVGLALAAPLGQPATIGPLALVALALALTVVRPTRGAGGALAWLALVSGVAVLAGLELGSARLAAIDAGRLQIAPGGDLAVTGTVTSAPRTSGEVTRFVLETPDGRIAVEADPALGAIDEGRIAVIAGTVREPAIWERSMLARAGAARVLVADSVEPLGSRTGLRGALDDVRRRAEAALERGAAPPASALLRGFVLGQDDRIAEEVREEFRRSGLAHVLAVSGQNVMLLAILATPLLALAGVPLRARLLAIALIIAVYVPVAGAGASIQRAGVMGIAGVVASLASRPIARWYALCLAAAITLAIDPRSTADIGWQLSFCAVAGLLVLAPSLIRIIGGGTAGPRRALAEGAAITLAASLATAPLAAHHFGTVSLTAIPANLVALPAIAPAMWLGMLAGAFGQIPGAPVEPLTWLGGHCAAFIGWVARALGPEWAQLDVPEPSAGAALTWTAVLVGGARLLCLAAERRQALRPRPRRPRRSVIALTALAVAGIAAAALLGRGGEAVRAPALAIRVLDVGQGDAILIEPRGHEPLLVDAGPPGSDLAARLSDRGITRIGGLAITHDDLDHSGGLAEVLEAVDVGRLFAPHGPPESCEQLDCPKTTRLAAGSRLRFGRTRIEVLWPPPAAPLAADPNETALVMAVSYGDFDALLTGDAEAEVARYGLGPVEFLKVAHHGSEDAGLAALLERTSPEFAAISVGDGNPYGHPAPATLAALESSHVPFLRTDDAGEVSIEIRGDGWAVR